MESYEVRVKRSAERELGAIAPRDRERVARRLVALADDPRPQGSERLTGRNGLRIRQGDYRILYEVDDAARVVHVVKIAHRREAYR